MIAKAVLLTTKISGQITAEIQRTFAKTAKEEAQNSSLIQTGDRQGLSKEAKQFLGSANSEIQM